MNHKKFAITISKKVAKSAVARNTLRRRVYSILREEMNTFPAGHFHIMAKAGAEKLRGEKLSNELKSLFGKVV